MTYQEAIKILNPDADVVWKAYDGKDMERCNEACRVACVALENQIPKKLKVEKVGRFGLAFLCPSCESQVAMIWDSVLQGKYEQDYCDNCGQALDWVEALINVGLRRKL